MKIIESPIRINKLEVKGRILMAPLGTYNSDENGHVTEKNLEHYRQRAANKNISLVITEHNYINQQGKAKPNQMSIADDSVIDGHRKLVDTIHSAGALAFIQINHAGSAAMHEASGMEPVAPSAVVLPTKPVLGDGVVPHELTVDEIHKIVDDFAAAALRAKKAGYDGVEIHSAHAYLLNQFYSPLTNHRTDDYGGSLYNRLRIHREVIEAVRQAVGKDYPVAIRLGGSDYMDGGSTIDDAVNAALAFEAAGVDMIDITGGMNRYMIKGHREPGYFSDLSEAVKNAVHVPVNLTGGVKTLDDAESLLEAGKSDMIGIGRALFKDANWQM